MNIQKEKIIFEREEKERLIDEKETVHIEQDEEASCSCKKTMRGINSCVNSIFMGIYSCFRFIIKGIYSCFGVCCFPIKERCCNCCDNIDTDLNPYKNPNYNPYDFI